MRPVAPLRAPDAAQTRDAVATRPHRPVLFQMRQATSKEELGVWLSRIVNDGPWRFGSLVSNQRDSGYLEVLAGRMKICLRLTDTRTRTTFTLAERHSE